MAAARLGYRCVVLAPEESCPAGDVARHLRGDYEDVDALAALARAADVVTFEFENVSATGLERLASLVPVRPSPAVLAVSQDRVAEKSFLNAIGVATAPWRPVAPGEAEEGGLQAAVEAIGLPAVLKTRRFGYDGKGQVVLRERDALAGAGALVGHAGAILEGLVDFAVEISVIVARGAGGTVAFDVVENRHRDAILDVTVAPARVAEAVAAEAVAIARRVAEALELEGVLAVEMFVDRDGRLLANEIAPRPHNSGHWTIDACPISQFEMQVRAVCGLALPPAVRHSDAVMRNLVGPEGMAEWETLLGRPGAIVHHYGKTHAKPGRKMGHVTHLLPRGAMPGEFGVQALLGRNDALEDRR